MHRTQLAEVPHVPQIQNRGNRLVHMWHSTYDSGTPGADLPKLQQQKNGYMAATGYPPRKTVR
jgi:hypothetical protein